LTPRAARPHGYRSGRPRGWSQDRLLLAHAASIVSYPVTSKPCRTHRTPASTPSPEHAGSAFRSPGLIPPVPGRTERRRITAPSRRFRTAGVEHFGAVPRDILGREPKVSAPDKVMPLAAGSNERWGCPCHRSKSAAGPVRPRATARRMWVGARRAGILNPGGHRHGGQSRTDGVRLHDLHQGER
jgi:hypothetical protein